MIQVSRVRLNVQLKLVRSAKNFKYGKTMKQAFLVLSYVKILLRLLGGTLHLAGSLHLMMMMMSLCLVVRSWQRSSFPSFYFLLILTLTHQTTN